MRKRNERLAGLLLSLALTIVLSGQTAPPMEITVMQTVFDFDTEGGQWSIIDDGVMGGLSRGQWRIEDGHGIFNGELSLENNGGFSSVRSGPLGVSLEGTTGFRLRIKGDGRSYQFRVRTDGNFDGVSYRAEFTTTKDEWQEVALDLGDFDAVFRGSVLKDFPALRAEKVVTVGFLLGDKKAGPFQLEVDWIGAVGPIAD